MSEDNLQEVFGTVKRVYGDGTADVLIDGSSTTERLANLGGALLGSRCIVVSDGTDLFILSASSCGSSSGGAVELTAVPVPVGSYWFTEDLRDPHVLWPGTAWESLSEGRGLVNTIDPARAGMLGGSDTLTEAQMPGHTHIQNAHAHGQNVTANSGGTGIRRDYNADLSGLTAYPQGINTDATTAANQNTGGGQSHQHPHRKVFIWRRLPDTGQVEQLNLTEISEKIEGFEHIVSTLELADFADVLDPNQKLKFEWGKILAINDDETLSVHISEYSSAVTAINWTGAAVGATVGMLCRGSERFAITVKNSVLNAGAIQAYGGSFESIPAGWLPCDGATYYTVDYPALYRIIGRAYTASTISVDRFTVPNLGGRVALGANASYAVGATGGAEKHVHGGTTAQNGTLGAAIGSVANTQGAIGFKAYNPPYGVNGFGNSTYTLSSGNVGSLPFNHFTAIAGATESADGRPPYTVVNYMISTGAGFDSSGSLTTAGIANGAVSAEKLSPDLQDTFGGGSYSLEERWTGKRWIDEKKVYQKTIEASVNLIVGTALMSHNITDFYRCIKTEGFVAPSATTTYVLPKIESTHQLGITHVNTTAVGIAGSYAWGNMPVSITIWYTKTKD